ncbi:hypothetical protein SDC9_93044 [bioreactor metagenome]|uniref:Uncharacterized protein n=1 Tax=bioreactor metagenome TaxID=1076179 RepID=A0A645A0A2_9ZZZZ
MARGPGGIDHQIDERVVDGAGAGQAQHACAVGAALELDTDVVDGRCVLESLGPVDIRRCGRSLQRLCLCGGNLR